MSAGDSSLLEDIVDRFLGSLASRFEFYRKRLDQVSELHVEAIDKLLNLPPMSSNDYHELAKEVLARSTNRNILTDLSSGTTGKRKFRLSSAIDDGAELDLCIDFFRRIGIDESDNCLAIDIDSADIYLFYGEALSSVGAKGLTFCSLTNSPEDCRSSIEVVNPTEGHLVFNLTVDGSGISATNKLDIS